MKNIIKKLTSHTLARGSALVFVGTMVANVVSYVYHLVIGRILGPSGYGELSSLISILYIFGVPTAVLQTVLAKYFSIAKAQNALGQAKYLYIAIIKRISIILLAGFFVFFICSPFIAGFLHLSQSNILFWVFLLFVLTTLTSISTSAAQGYQLFVWIAIFSGGALLLKLGISIPFAYRGVEATMIAANIAAAIVFIAYFFPIRFFFRVKSEKHTVTKKDMLLYSIPTFFSILGMTSLYSADIVLVRHFLPSHDAGIYAAVAVLGKVIFYASSAIGTVLFPVLSERHEKKEASGHIVRLALILVAAVSLCITGVYFAFPLFVTHALFGSSFSSAAQYLGLFGVFITCYSIGNIFVSACLALERMQIWIVSLCLAILQIVLISLFHTSVFNIIVINIIVSFLLVVLSGGYYWYANHKHHYSCI